MTKNTGRLWNGKLGLLEGVHASKATSKARLRARLDEELGLPGFSIGIALWDEHDQELSPVLHRADVAMYADKAARRANREQISEAA